MVDVEFEVGNFHKEAKNIKGRNNQYLTPFIRIKDPKNRKVISKLISNAKFILHESFKRRFYEHTTKDGDTMVSVTWNGWGTFGMPIQVSWTKESGIEGITTFDHDLEFKDNWSTHKVKMDSRVIDKYFKK